MLQEIVIGFLLSPGFRPADIIGLDAVLGLHPRNKVYYISEDDSVVYGKSNFGIKPNVSFNNCPRLDVLVVGEMHDRSITNTTILDFIANKSTEAQYVIAVSNGVLALYNAKVITKQTVSSDKATLKLLKGSSLSLKSERKCVTDGKYITAGPSTGGIEAAFIVLDKMRGKWFTKFIEFNLEYNAIVQFPVDKDILLEKPDTPGAIKVGVFAPDDIYLPDIIGAVDVFGCLPNAELYFIGKRKGLSKAIKGPNIMTNMTIEDCPPLDVLIIGASHPRYVKDDETLNFILEQEKSAQAIISVCAGTFIVGSAGLLEGKVAATNYHQTRDLNRIGSRYTGKEVEVDGKFYSAGPAVGSYEVGIKAVGKVISDEWARYIENELLEFNPNPIYGTNQENVSKSILRTTNTLSFFVRKIYRPYIRKGYYGARMKR
jgi:cyclohexyl-isocyanide hydratase